MREKLAIWGAASQALIVADIIRLRDQYEIAGFLDNVNPERARTTFCGASILGGEEQLDDLRQRGVTHLICAFGINRIRLQLAQLAHDKGFQLASAIHPATAIASGVPIGAGTGFMAGVVINPVPGLGQRAVVSPMARIKQGAATGAGAWINPPPFWVGG